MYRVKYIANYISNIKKTIFWNLKKCFKLKFENLMPFSRKNITK